MTPFRRNIIILLLLVIGTCCFLYLTRYGFQLNVESKTWVFGWKSLIFFLSCVLIFMTKARWYVKLGGLMVIIFLLLYLIPRSGIWKHSLYTYVNKNKAQYEEFVNSFRKVDTAEIYHFYCSLEGSYNTAYLENDSLRIAEEILAHNLCGKLEKLDTREVFINHRDGLYLFAFNRFIDNGSGIVYSKNIISIDDLRSKSISGLVLRSPVKITEHWFYVSFT